MIFSFFNYYFYYLLKFLFIKYITKSELIALSLHKFHNYGILHIYFLNNSHVNNLIRVGFHFELKSKMSLTLKLSICGTKQTLTSSKKLERILF